MIGEESREVRNARTGESVRFIRTGEETGGELLVMEDRWARADHSTTRHSHPSMEERWEVLEGTVGFQIGERELEAGPGQIVIAPAGATHTAWNAGTEPVLMRIEMRPAMRWESFVRQLFALAGEELDDATGERSVVELLTEFAPEVVVDQG